MKSQKKSQIFKSGLTEANVFALRRKTFSRGTTHRRLANFVDNGDVEEQAHEIISGESHHLLVGDDQLVRRDAGLQM